MDIINHEGIDTATKFILPMVMKNDATYENVPKSIYKTCISIFDRPEFDDHIILVSTSFVDPPKRRKDLYFRKLYDEDTKDYYFIFEIPVEYEEDLNKILNGNYYNLSEEYKQRLVHFWQDNNRSKLTLLLYGNYKYQKPLVRELIHGMGGS